MKSLVALGSNLGNRLTHLKIAAAEMRAISSNPVRKSPVYETSPVDCPPDSPKFLNAVIEFDVADDISPRDLLKRLQAIETKLGRKSKQLHNESRPIDLDLIYCGDLRVNTPDLILPHPRAHVRRFVLQPLCDLSPELVLPGQPKTVRELLAALPPGENVTRLSASW